MNLCPADPALRASECKAFYVFKVNHFENEDLSTMMSVCLSLPQMHPNATLNFCLTFVVHYGHLQVFYCTISCCFGRASYLSFYTSINLSTYPFLFIHLYSESACKEHDPLAFLWFGINEGKKGFCSF